MSTGRQAFVERLFAAQGRALRAFFYRRVRHVQEAADLAQEVYVRLLGADTEAIRNPEAYLYTVAANLAREHAVHSRGPRQAVDINSPAVQDQLAVLPDLGGEVDRTVRVRRLKEVLDQLPPRCHAAVLLQYQQGLSYAQIAEQLGVSSHMVKKYLSQALVHCRRRMARLG